MNYTLMPSLKHIALVKIVTTLWNQDDIRALMTKYWFQLLVSERRGEWQKVEDKVVEKVPHLPQPKSLKEEILGFIKPVGLQIFKWMEYHDENCSLGADLPNELCWTPLGTVDRKKTVEILINNESLDITTRYKLSCIYCLEDDILELWNKMPENLRESFYCEDPIKVRQQELVVLWTYDIMGEVARMDDRIERRCQCRCSPYQYAFRYAAVGGNKAATEYFLQKLTPTERAESLVRSIRYSANRCGARIDTGFLKEHYADVLCFLLSEMDEEQQIEVFRGDPYKVLKGLLDWPWQSLFMETADRMWDFLPERDYNLLLRMIVDKVIDGYKDCNYQKLFGEFWKQSPDANKRFLFGRSVLLCRILPVLFELEDEENVKLLLKDATLTEKEEIIFCDQHEICEILIYLDKWNLLKYFVQECLSSKDIIVKLKKAFKERYIRRRSRAALKKDKRWYKFFQLLDNLAQENDKRSTEEGERSPAKRLCSIEFKEVERSMKK